MQSTAYLRARNLKACRTLLAVLDVHPRVAMHSSAQRIGVTMEIYTEATSEVTCAALKRLCDELSQHDDH